jgi:filamentous hemagglutinin family protein
MFKEKVFFKGISLFTLICFVLFQTSAYALPQGAEVVAGNVSINTSGSNMDINITTDKAITNWESFSIAQPESVNFHQLSSSSVALNRVVGTDPSSILGRLSANGKIFLINPTALSLAKTL